MGLDVQERVTAVKDKGGAGRSRQKESSEGNKGLIPWKQREGRLGSNGLRLQCSSKRGSAKAVGSPHVKLPIERVLYCTEIGPHLYCIMLRHWLGATYGNCDLGANAVVHSERQLPAP